MAAFPSAMAMSDCSLLDAGVKVILVPVGNSPGPDVMDRVTATLLLMGLPLLSRTVTTNCASSVPSTAERLVLSAVSCRAAGVPLVGQVGGGTLA